MKQTLVKIVAALQIVVGVLLLVGTVGLTTTAYRTVRNESEQLAANLSASAEALESLRATYEQSATSLFGLTEAMDDVSAKLVVVSGAISETGRRFSEYGKVEESPLLSMLKPFTEWFKSSGEKLKEVGRDVRAVSVALSGQSEAIKTYRADGHDKTMDAITKTAESLRHAMQMLGNGNSAARWCGFVCLLGFCVSMLFFANGMLLFLFARIETKMPN